MLNKEALAYKNTKIKFTLNTVKFVVDNAKEISLFLAKLVLLVLVCNLTLYLITYKDIYV